MIAASCCGPANNHFGSLRAQDDLSEYRRHGPTGPARLMLDLLRQANVTPSTLLDIGAGVGVLHHELLLAGVERAVHVEGAAAYVQAAQSEARRRGQLDRVRFIHGDVVAAATGEDLGPAELVTLNRVVCCYADLDALLETTTTLTCRYLALSYPRERFYNRAWTAWENFGRRLAGDAFRTYIHSVNRIRRIMSAAGLKLVSSRRTLVWEVCLYGRPCRSTAVSQGS